MITLLADIVLKFPKRLVLFFSYIIGQTKPCLRIGPKHVPKWVAWLFDLSLLLLDIFGISELFELKMRLFMRHIRRLTSAEIALSKTYFGDNIDYERVRINEKSWLVPSKHRNLAFVTFYIINSKQPLTPDHFIHEMTHVFQNEKFGAVYISRSLLAQKTTKGYNYGGINELTSANQIYEFNLEQQADIIADTYRIQRGIYPRWAEFNLKAQKQLERLSGQVFV